MESAIATRQEILELLTDAGSLAPNAVVVIAVEA